jgi:DNA-binding winged helix-turn-helix (wHTH) protein
MAQPAPSRAILRFEDYTLDLRAGELYKSGHKIRLQEQPFQILTMLLQHAGEVVTREELRHELWPENTFVDFEHGLNTAIKKLRQALHEEADNPRLVETLPRRGYRFTGSVQEGSTPAPSPPRSPIATGRGMVGGIFGVYDRGGATLVCLPVDEATLAEKEKLEAADDSLGFSLLSASERLLLVRTGTRVRVLEARSANSCYEVRILEGEHMAKTAIVRSEQLGESG